MRRTAWVYILFFTIIPFFCDASLPPRTQIQAHILKQFDTIEYNDIGRKASTAELKGLIDTSKQIHFREGVLRGLILLQRNALRQNEYALAENYGDDAAQLASSLNDQHSLSLIHLNRIRTAIGLGFYTEAKEMINSAEFDHKIPNEVDRSLYRCNSELLLAGIFSKQGKNDSLLFYTEKSLKTVQSIPILSLSYSQKTRYYYYLIFQLMNMGIAYTYKVNPPEINLAESYFQEALSYEKTHPQYFKLCNIEVYESVSAFYLTKGDYYKCIEFSKKVLDHERIKNKPEERLDAYMEIKDAYKALGNTEEELKYLRLYQQLSDSLKDSQKKDAIDLSRKKITEIKKETKTNYSKLRIATLGFSTAIVLIFSYFNIRKRRKYHKHYTLLIHKLQANQKKIEETENEEKSATTGKSLISDEARRKLLKKLEQFERSEKFLRKEMTLTSLSNLLGTNPKYLSDIIKNSKSQNFNNYINGLKINFIVRKLFNDPEYREYKISYLAEKCGYASPQVFVIAFKKEHGVTPSYFITQLKLNLNARSDTITSS